MERERLARAASQLAGQRTILEEQLRRGRADSETAEAARLEVDREANKVRHLRRAASAPSEPRVSEHKDAAAVAAATRLSRRQPAEVEAARRTLSKSASTARASEGVCQEAPGTVGERPGTATRK